MEPCAHPPPSVPTGLLTYIMPLLWPEQKESKGKGVLVAMNGSVLGAASVLKMNTVDVQTFQAPNDGALGYVLNGKVTYNMSSAKKHTTQSVFDVTSLNSLPQSWYRLQLFKHRSRYRRPNVR